MHANLDFTIFKTNPSVSLQAGFVSALPYLVMAITIQTGGHIADCLRRKQVLTTTVVRKLFNSFGKSAWITTCLSSIHVESSLFTTFGLLCAMGGKWKKKRPRPTERLEQACFRHVRYSTPKIPYWWLFLLRSVSDWLLLSYVFPRSTNNQSETWTQASPTPVGSNYR